MPDTEGQATPYGQRDDQAHRAHTPTVFLYDRHHTVRAYIWHDGGARLTLGSHAYELTPAMVRALLGDIVQGRHQRLNGQADTPPEAEAEATP